MWGSFKRNFDSVRFMLTLTIATIWCTGSLIWAFIK